MKKLSEKQIEMITTLNRFRFLTRKQLQYLTGNKRHEHVYRMLNKLIDQHYLSKLDHYYKGAVSIYSLGNKGRKYIIDSQEIGRCSRLDWVWRSGNYKPATFDKYLAVADLYISFKEASDETLRFWTKTELSTINGLLSPPPDAYFIFNERRFFLEMFTTALSRVLYERVSAYAMYFDSGVWQERTGHDFPELVLICSDKAPVAKLRRFIPTLNEPKMKFIIGDRRTLSSLQPKKKTRETNPEPNS